ncbi:hypothetical protein IAQ61_002286 [Plenodomus lingam]|uniref:uncharacterized protein n=1 Tax=Leptosphaeria maculans TaxID=5022 RepID=UPI00332EFC4C|nr:hypothetical protein IAQ61_002286 [Plenodomus lingam]
MTRRMRSGSGDVNKAVTGLDRLPRETCQEAGGAELTVRYGNIAPPYPDTFSLNTKPLFLVGAWRYIISRDTFKIW